ncbi:MAG: mercury methylation corrinoid protein HgcA [Chloroflexota bacterium]
MSASGSVPRVSTALTISDHWEHVKCRISAFRHSYSVPPGLYAVGEPDRSSDVLVSANYKLSFDALRRELTGLDAWILVLDTKGINVWCAAGKGTFGTEELVGRIRSAQLDKVVDHRRIILPQLCAPGVSAHKVGRATGFRVLYGPVQARDIPAYIKAGYKASREMRTVAFTLHDRLVLTPMEVVPAMKKFPIYAAAILIILGLSPSGILFKDAWAGGLPLLVLGLVAVLAGAFFTPLLLPFIPFRSFAMKGWLVGLLSLYLSSQFVTPPDQHSVLLLAFSYLFFPLASSYIALQFTGATTFTGMSGVKRELKFALPVYVSVGAVSVMLLAGFKLVQWGVL